MKNLLKIENLLIVIYGLIAAVALWAIFVWRVNERLAMPVLIGLFSIAPFVIFYRSANRISPRFCKLFLGIYAVLAVLLFIPALKFAVCLPIPLFIVFLFLIKRERLDGFANWLEKNKFSDVRNKPEEILETLGREKNWQCFANSFFLRDGREIPYLVWFGNQKTSVMTNSGGTTVHSTAYIPQIALSFFPETVGEKFMHSLESKNAAKQSFWQNLKPKSQEEFPFQTARLADGGFVAAWSILHIADILDEKLGEIKTLLENSN